MLQVAQLRLGLEPKLIVEAGADRAVDLERLGLAAGSVQREHQLSVEPLAQRMVSTDSLQLADQHPVTPEREFRLDSLLERRQPLLLQPHHLWSCELLVGEITERRPAPERERLGEPFRRSLVVPGVERATSVLDKALETFEVELLRL